RYTALTGRPALPPAWSFGLWLSTSFTTDYDETTVTRQITEMAERDIPLHVFHFDCFWMRAFRWCDFTWDTLVFPDPHGMLARLKKRGLKISVWINPYISQRSSLFDEAVANGFLLQRPDGGVWQTDDWQPGMGIVDFTHPDARTWFAYKLSALLDMGVDCFKTDFGERIPTDALYHDGSDPEKMHNYYAYLYNKTVFETIRKTRGDGNAVVFARAATAGSQRFPVHWGGDSTATFVSMAESLRGGLSLGLSGFGFWSHDIGGFEDTAPPSVYKRWCAFGLVSSHSRLHGNNSYRVPWLYDEEAVDVLRFFTKLKCRLMPYLFGAACVAHREGIPVLRAMLLEFPDDPACRTLDLQYMLGGSLLVAPVFREDGTAEYYLPAGTWTNLLTGEKARGGEWRRETHSYLSLPLWVRPETILALGANDHAVEYDYADKVELYIFEPEDGAPLHTEVPAVDGRTALTVEAHRSGDTLDVRVTGARKPWRVVLKNFPAAVGANCTTERHGNDTVLMPEKPTRALRVRLG
ncbi:MAG TPA: alpha-xylosidase, partial [Spirochaetia bacterium]|nr:alpha-xylosidase [Spirochaetia bacterium]